MIAGISFRPMAQEDIDLYKAWASREHVRSVWFCEGYEPVEAIYSKIEGNGYDYPYLILLNGQPIGYIVTSDLFSYKKMCPNPKGLFTDETEGTYSIDLFIGEEELLNKGYGTEVVRSFTEFLFKERGAKRVVIDPDLKNKRALRCYEKAGFTPVGCQHDGVVDAMIFEKFRPISRPQISVFIAASLDGYIADERGSVDFLYSVPAQGGEDCGFGAFIDTVDTIIMGRKTYEVTLELTRGQWPHNGKRVIVLSETLNEVHRQAELYRGAIDDLMANLQRENASHCWVDGGAVITSFLKKGFVDRFTLSVIPVILGSGIPLFNVVGRRVPLRLLEAKAYPFGVAQLLYQVERDK